MKKRLLALFLCLITLLTMLPVSVSAEAISLAITTQPESCSAKAGDSFSLQVAATGEGLAYQWFSSDGSEFLDTGITTDTYTAVMTEELDGSRFYCVITDQEGNSVQSDTVTVTLKISKPEITQQPKNASADPGKRVYVTVEATGDGLSYQWYFRNAGGSKFAKSSYASKTYSAPMRDVSDGRQIYCVITDKNGNSVQSDTVTISINKPQITKQPKNASAHPKKKVSTTVSATGKGLTYQWYFCNAGSSKFSKSSITSKTYATTMKDSVNGRKVYCVITDRNGYSVKTNTVTLKLLKPEITEQPQNSYVKIGKIASASVSASGEGLRYQWYFRDAGSSKFSKASAKSSTYKVTMSSARNGRQIYCVITDAYGVSVTSKTVTLKVPQYAKITKQPKSTSIAINTTGSCSVGATGDGLTYQWYLSSDNGDSFRKSSITKATYSLKMVPEKSGRLFYCVVTDRYGNSVQSKTVKLTARGTFKQSTYSLKVDATKDLSKELNFTTEDVLVWKSSNPSAVSITEEGIVTRHNKGTVTITATGVNTGITASCQVRVPGTKQIAMTFDDGPSAHTARLLDYLATTDAKVTFFMVGTRVTNTYKTNLKRMAAQGHELGYHSYSHKTQTSLSSSQISSDFKKTDKALYAITGKHFTLWRTPGGAYNDRVLKCVPLPHIYWSVDTLDWKYRNANTVYNSIVKNAKDGAIILLHDLHGTSVDGAIRAMKKLEKDGYEFVTVTELLSRNGKAPKPSTNYNRG